MCPKLPMNSQSNSQKKLANIPKNDSNKDQTLTNQSNTHVFLQTLKVTLKGDTGTRKVRALIDSGSQRSYILKETAAYLGYRSKYSETIVHCLFGGKEISSRHECYDVTMCGRKHSLKFEALDQVTICGNVSPVFNGSWTDELKALNIEVSDSGSSGPIEILLGADIAGKLYTGNQKELKCGLIALETIFGWTIMGGIPIEHKRSDVVMTTLNLFAKNASICELWELDFIGIKDPTEFATKEEMAKAAKQFFLDTVKINDEGRYEVRLPWLEGHPPLPTNRNLAHKRLNSTIRKLNSDAQFKSYGNVFSEWQIERIIDIVEPNEKNIHDHGHYLPHRPVIKEESLTTKIRPVFDASAHEKGKPSLNNCLEKGPNLIELIPSMLLKFRENKIGLTADIRKAFLQISIDEKDREFLKFLWVDPQGNEIVFRHNRVVFGLNSSPFLLGATIDYHLSRCLEESNKSLKLYSNQTIHKLRRSFYVDNCVTSVSDEASVDKFITESVALMAEGQFDLRGWERTGHSHTDIGEPFLVLGLSWCPQKDILTISPKFLDCESLNVVVTKRHILSIAQKLFDPIGFICPTVLKPKLMLQKLWERKITWDDPVDDETAQAFRSWVEELHLLQNVEIPRWIHLDNPYVKDISIHTFCDASKDAYACVVYLRVESTERVEIFLLGAKTKVAPLKKSSSKMTIPRLELLAATIGARLYASIVKVLEKDIESYFWSDSSTVVSWIQRNEQWGVFVWNRVQEIKDLTPVEKWRHLPGTYNPADLPSRGCSPKRLLQTKWWEGPSWLYENVDRWPKSDLKYNEEEINSERKKILVTTLLNKSKNVDWHLHYFSKYTKTIRMIAWIFRYVFNLRNPNSKRKGELCSEEIIKAEKFTLKIVQQEAFGAVENDKLKGLNPFLDEQGLICLKTKVSNRKDTHDYRFPIVLPAKHLLVNNLILETHVRLCHAGTHCLLTQLRERFWILGGRRTIRSVIRKCVVCRRHDAKPLIVESPPLPIDRVRDATAFEVTGVDFAGPLFLKKGEKAWICLFTCAVFRAVHVELTTSLSTASFLQAFRRFVSRRGRPKTVYSDNGTNFVGAENAFSKLDWDIITRETDVQRISWRFNPPTAAWWGGFWERLIGILKQFLKKVLGRACLDYQDLLTLLCECEAIINSRPLTYLSDDPNDLVPLTPSMFLRDQIQCYLPDCDAIDNNSLSRKVRRIQKLRDDLRARFRSEYLGQLKCYGNRQKSSPITIGEIVLVGNDNTKRLEWPIARVVELLPGKDKKVRLVRVQTAKGQMLRPLQRIYPLECGGFPGPEKNSNGGEDCADPIGLQSVSDTASDGQVSESVVKVSSEPNSAQRNSEYITRVGRISKPPQRFSF